LLKVYSLAVFLLLSLNSITYLIEVFSMQQQVILRIF